MKACLFLWPLVLSTVTRSNVKSSSAVVALVAAANCIDACPCVGTQADVCESQ